MLTALHRDRAAWLSVPIHPILVAVFPVLFLFAENAIQQVTLKPLWIPLGLSFAAGVASLLVLSAILRDWQRGALLASLLLGLFFSYGHVWNLVGNIVRQRWVLAGIWVALAVAGVVVAVLARRIKGGRWVVPLGQFLNVAFLLLVVYNGFRVANYASESATAAATVAPPATITMHPPAKLPDIYYIILDRYAGVDSLRDIYGFDNEPFMRELEKRGFAIAPHAWANYFKTALSVYSSMSMDTVSKQKLGETSPPYDFTRIFAALRDHLTVPSALKSIGYHYILLPNYWEPTAYNADADITLRYQENSEFSSALTSTTFLSAIFPPVSGSGGEQDGETSNSHDLAVKTTLFTFDQLAETERRPGPNFVFAHILLPHPPYVFGADGHQLTDAERRRHTEKENYIAQLQYANTKVLAAIDTLLSDPNDPVIVLQADEGPWPRAFSEQDGDFKWLKASAKQIYQKFNILNAIHLPNGEDPHKYGFTDHTSPVNEFRVVFNAVFGSNLPMLPDMTYLSPDYDHMYDFVEYPPPLPSSSPSASPP